VASITGAANLLAALLTGAEATLSQLASAAKAALKGSGKETDGAALAATPYGLAVERLVLYALAWR
jgi:hypothetical protein